MSIKDMLLKLRQKITELEVKGKSSTTILLPKVIDIHLKNNLPEEFQIKDFNSSKSIDLNDKVDEFIDWYFKNMVKGHYSDIGKYNKSREMRDFIEKMAIWYELRYPDYEINRLMYCEGQEDKEISDIMFKKNNYINALVDDNSDVRVFDWDEFYNTNSFIQSLPFNERAFFQIEEYTNLRYNDKIRIGLTSTGIINHLTGFNFLLWSTPDKNPNEIFIGMHITEALPIMKKMCGNRDALEGLENAIMKIENKRIQKEEMLNCVMYRIIERGGNRIGPRRALLFAKEFGRNIDIPMMYAVDRTDPGLRMFVNEYVKAGGSKDLKCYVGYFGRTSKNQKLNTISIQELILTQNNNAATFYTPEESELHQRLVDSLASQIDQDILRKEEVKGLRLERKLQKSKINKD